MKKISILYENMHSCKPEDYYRDIIVQPITRKVITIDKLTFKTALYIFETNNRTVINKALLDTSELSEVKKSFLFLQNKFQYSNVKRST